MTILFAEYNIIMIMTLVRTGNRIMNMLYITDQDMLMTKYWRREKIMKILILYEMTRQIMLFT